MNTVEGWNQVDASERVHRPGSLPRGGEGAAVRLRVDADRRLRGHPVLGRLEPLLQAVRLGQGLLQRPRPCYAGLRRVREHLPRHRPSSRTSSSTGRPTTRPRSSTGRSAAKPKSPGLLGFADDNWLNGTQSGVFSFVYPGAVAAGYGLTTTMIHEYGHHSSMSHPHDGYDPGTGVDFGPSGDTFFAWLGDESNSIMSYIDLNWDFSQFDRDNSARHHAAGYAKIANIVAARLPGRPAAAPKLAEAERDARRPRRRRSRRTTTRRRCVSREDAYEHVVAGAAPPNVPVDDRRAEHLDGRRPGKPGNGPGKAEAKAAYAQRPRASGRTSSGCSASSTRSRRGRRGPR